MIPIDGDVVGARFEADGRLSVTLTAKLAPGASAATLRAAHLSVRRAPEEAGAAALATGSVTDLDVALSPDAAWESTLTFPLDVSNAARAIGQATIALEPAEGEPLGIRFDFAAAPARVPPPPARAAKKTGRSLVPFFLALVVVGALVLASRVC